MSTERKIDRDMLECAKINLENFEQAMPIIKQHPFWIIAKAQLDDGLGYQSVEKSLEAFERIEGI